MSNQEFGTHIIVSLKFRNGSESSTVKSALFCVRKVGYLVNCIPMKPLSVLPGRFCALSLEFSIGSVILKDPPLPGLIEICLMLFSPKE